MAKRQPANIDVDVCQSLFDANPETFNGYSILAGKALYLALFDRRTARRLHVMKRSMRNSGHKDWGGMKK